MNGRLTAMLILTTLLLKQMSVGAAPPAEPIVTNKSHFRIPFKVEPGSLQRLNARELQLHVSTDRGTTWELAQKLPPESSKFEYQASGDGEYWFAVKTLDGRGQLHPPAGQYEKGLAVVVDTANPLLELTLQQVSAGKVQLSWNGADANLDPSTLKMEFIQPGSPDWEPVDVTPKSSGQISWNIPKAGKVSVRGTIADFAGNVGRGQTQVNVAASELPAKPKSKARVPIAEQSPAQETAARDPDVSRGAVVPRQDPPALPDPARTVASPRKSRTIEESAVADYRGPVIAPFGAMEIPSQVSSTNALPSRTVSSDPVSRPEITRDQSESVPDSPMPTTPSFAASNISTPNPAATNRSSPNKRVVNSRRFQIGYSIDDIGPSGIGAVELFITQDNGRKWWKYGDDPDRRSPIEVDVPQDGEYGFAIRVRSGAGLASEPPLSGELPSIVVCIDQTPPVVEIVSAQQGQGAASNRAQVRWRISDEHLASKPISVYYSVNRNGPWEPLSTWREDTGSFEWTITAGSPSQIYLRVMARDMAGNIGKAETLQPILIDLVRPTARIVDVEAPQATVPQ